jgi:hypothetical protein
LKRFTLTTGLLVVATAVLASSPTKSEWADDLRFLREELPKHHKNFFHRMTRADFDAAVAALGRRLPELSDLQIVVEIQKIAASIGDGHSGVSELPPALTPRFLPLKVYLYADGVFIQAIDPTHREFAGGEVLAIDEVPIDEVLRRVRTVTDGTNDMAQRDFMAFRMVRPEILHALDITHELESATFLVKTNAGVKKLILRPLPRAADGSPERGGSWFLLGPKPGSDWADARHSPAVPLWLKDQANPFWHAYLPASKVFYVQCNLVGDQDGKSLAQAFDGAIREASASELERFVLDLRLNGGGDNSLLLPVIHALIRADKIDRPGRFFVLIGRRTQSAAQNFVNLLQIHTHAIFVGEPTGESPNHYGDPEPIKLPHSGIEISVSTLWWQDMGPRDERPWTEPQISAPLRSSDYRDGRDPALDAVEAYRSRE